MFTLENVHNMYVCDGESSHTYTYSFVRITSVQYASERCESIPLESGDDSCTQKTNVIIALRVCVTIGKKVWTVHARCARRRMKNWYRIVGKYIIFLRDTHLVDVSGGASNYASRGTRSWSSRKHIVRVTKIYYCCEFGNRFWILPAREYLSLAT